MPLIKWVNFFSELKCKLKHLLMLIIKTNFNITLWFPTPSLVYRFVCHGFRLMKQSLGPFWPFLNCAVFKEVAGAAVLKIGSSLKPNHHWEIWLAQILETLVMIEGIFVLLLPRCQFHQHFTKDFFCTKAFCAAFL